MTDRELRGDGPLVRRIAQNDERALAELYDGYAGLVFSMSASILRSDADAEEVTAAVFAKVWQDASTYDPARGSVRAWIVTMARSQSIDRLRARDRRQAAIGRAATQNVDGVATPLTRQEPADRLAEQGSLRQAVLHALGELPEAQRKVVQLAYYAGLSQTEIARHLDEPLGTIKTRARAALRKLRACLVAHDGAER